MATSMETLTTLTKSAQAPAAQARQFQGVFDVIPFTFSIEEDSLGAEDTANADITVTGAELGDFVLVSAEVDLVSLTLGAFVQSDDTVTVFVTNQETADANTTLATAVDGKGIVLKPKGSFPFDA